MARRFCLRNECVPTVEAKWTIGNLKAISHMRTSKIYVPYYSPSLPTTLEINFITKPVDVRRRRKQQSADILIFFHRISSPYKQYWRYFRTKWGWGGYSASVKAGDCFISAAPHHPAMNDLAYRVVRIYAPVMSRTTETGYKFSDYIRKN